jgi:mono/diheme cytochrome c family protein
MKLSKLIIFAMLALGLGLSAARAADPKTPAELEKEKAMANPYPNDFGPDTLDAETLKSYPAGAQAGYKLLRGAGDKKNCQTCHTSSRPLNSRFVEPEGKDTAEKEAAVAKIKKDHPEYFSKENKGIWQIEPEIWKRYVKRMMAKPGCGISNEDGKKIWQFLVYDGSHRKIGANGEKWKAHREKLIGELKTKKAARYDELAKDNDL